MMSSRKALYGTWTSPITTDALVQKNIPLLDVLVDPVTDKVYHLERRSAEGGRAVVVDTSTGADVIGQEWNATTRRSALHVARIRPDANGGFALEDNERIAWDDPGREIVVGFPQWIDGETLLFTSDETGYLNPRIYSVPSKTHTALLASPISQDFSDIPWRLGGSPYTILPASNGSAKADSILLSAFSQGRQILYLLDLTSKTLVPVESPFVEVVSIRATGPASVVFIAKSPTAPQAVVHLTLQPSVSHPDIVHTTHRVLKSSMDSSPFPTGIVSQPLPLTLDIGGEPVHVVLYQPTNPAYDGSTDASERPPCIVNAHGGPTSYAGQGINWEKQYFTSRGWAWLDVNYGGSSGYGRKYADRLYGTWGVADVADVAHAATQLASEPHQLIDPARTAVRGSSSGGFTVLAALCTFPRAFAAGASLYGISDLRALTEGSHKFEHKYMDKLLGGSYDDVPEVYEERSPVSNAQKIGCPLLILQGLEDRVVPPEQAEVIVAKVRGHGGQVEYVAFEGEAHGWARAETVKRALEAERGFYERVFGIAGGP
ncbi:Alpha/Beta hydrolase protein [Amylostereum chailletii]|nr:Alpha/Beta hydrolase protein [Amylostereum chailletii]